MVITYKVGSGLYVNVTNRCTNSCDFCVRSVADGTYGSLWLEREPTKEEILNDILSYDLSLYSELVFCGYGEPSLRIHDIAQIVAEIKKLSSIYIKVRINTNGHALLIYGDEILPLFCGTFDEISVSLNAPNAKKYNEICHPCYGNATFSAILNFVRSAKRYTKNVVFSVVEGTLSELEMNECKELAESCGVPLKIRKFISK